MPQTLRSAAESGKWGGIKKSVAPIMTRIDSARLRPLPADSPGYMRDEPGV
jgi:hypothetical protein